MTAARAAARDHRAQARLLPRLALYRVSGGRAGSSPDLYRAAVPWQPLTLGDLPGMTALTERAYYAWHCRELFTGVGEIVDLGAWFGSTTASLASGLVKNRKPAARARNVHAYDQFVWEPWMDDYARLAAFGPYEPGDSFQREFDRVVARWHDRVEVHPGDLHEQVWPGGPIELLLVDAMKSWSLAGRIAAEFYPAVIPDSGVIIHQDFANAYTPWIHLSTYRMRDCLVPAVDVPGSETVVFRLVRGFADDGGVGEESRDAFGDEEVDRAFAHSLSITEPAKHLGIRAASVMMRIYDGDFERAAAMLDSFSRTGGIDPGRASALHHELHHARALSAGS